MKVHTRFHFKDEKEVTTLYEFETESEMHESGFLSDHRRTTCFVSGGKYYVGGHFGDEFIETRSALETGINGIVALWDANDDIIYFCKKENYNFPADKVGLYADDVLFLTREVDLFYSVHFEERKCRLKKALGLCECE